MYLKKLEMMGFKSFADRAELLFQPGMTAIVGPNGCGKSNVVDAFKWILGEQSAKGMRGGEMKDVIFNGTQERKPTGFAEVTIAFENTDRFLDIDYSEVALTRRLYRSGESEYLINKQKARLKDIRELFMGTGVGQTSYSILEQGKIDVLLQASNVDRRCIFEEAAGISKYLARKAEALRALLRVEENLTRLNDIVEEVDRRLQRVKAQASKARRHREITERLRELRVRSTLVEWRESRTARIDLSFRLHWYDLRLEELSELISRISETCSQASRERQERGRIIRELGESLGQDRMQEERTLERIRQGRHRLVELEAERRRKAEELEASQRGLEDLRARVDEERQGLVDVERETGARRGACARCAEELQDVRAGREAIERDLKQRREALVGLLHRRSRLNNSLVSIDSEIGNLHARRERLSALLDGLRSQLEQVREKRSSELRRLDDLRAEEARLRASIESLDARIAELEDRAAGLERELAAVRDDINRRRSRLDVLEGLEQTLSGVGRGVADVLRKKDSAPELAEVHGMVGSFVTVESRFSMAVEAALGDRAQSLLVETQDGALALLGHARSEGVGALEIVSLDRVEPAWIQSFPPQTGVIGALRERVQVPEDFEDLFDRLLANVVLVEDFSTAMALSRNGLRPFRLVTLDGELLEPWGGLSIPGERGLGLISRRSEINELRGALGDLERRRELIEGSVESVAGEVAGLQTERGALREQLSRTDRGRVQIESGLEQLAREDDRLGRESSLSSSELADVDDQLATRDGERLSVVSELSGVEDEVRRSEEAIAGLDHALAGSAEAERVAVERLTQARLALGQSEQSEAGTRELIESMERGVSDHETRNANLRTELDSLSRRHEDLGGTIEACEAELAGISERQAVIRRDLEREESVDRDLSAQEQKLRDLLESLHAERSEVQTERQGVELRDQEERQRRNILSERIAEDYQVDVERLLDLEADAMDLIAGSETPIGGTLPCEPGVDPTVGAEGRGGETPDTAEAVGRRLEAAGFPRDCRYLVPDPEWNKDRAREEIKDLQEKIRRLGAVNLEALDELQELEERSRFQKAQRADLQESEKNLRGIIAEINKTSREMFLKTFQEVQMHFSELFRKCFGGGKAELVLEEGADVLEAGVDIVARPPGKKITRLSLMSGGEKTMTTIALLFAIFRTRPSPFCILDEVDAPLDETNVRRFVVLLKDFLQHTQFIVVTHNKLTMAEASTLYGVTMEERGVSKRVSVELSSYDPEKLEAVAAR